MVPADVWEQYKRTLEGLATIVSSVTDFEDGEAFLQKAAELAFRAGYQHGRRSVMEEFKDAMKHSNPH